MNSSTFNSDPPGGSSRRRRFPNALLAAAGMVLVIELFVAARPHPERKDLVRHRLYNPNVTPGIAESVVQWQVANATLLKEKQDLVLLGDSACLSGLDARRLMELTGLRTWNLGTFGFTYTTGHADILELFIEVNGPPHFLVYNTSHYPLSAGRRKRAVRTWVGRLREWISPPEIKRYLLPSLRYRQEIRNEILSLGAESVPYTGLDRPRGNFPSDNEMRRVLWENRGTLPPVYEEGDFEDWFEGDLAWAPRFNPDCVSGLKRIFEIARKHNFPILILFNPLPEGSDSKMVRRAMAALEKALRETIQPYPRVTLYQPFLRFYPDDHCIDMRHATLPGNRRNTAELAEWINEHWPDRSG